MCELAARWLRLALKYVLTDLMDRRKKFSLPLELDGYPASEISG